MSLLLPIQDTESGAEFSEDRAYRWRLWRHWSKGPIICWCMLNPSTANETDLDPTVRRCVSFARKWGFGGIEIVNLFGIVSADPSVLRTNPDPIGIWNDDAIRDAVARSQRIVAAWGAFPEARERSKQVVEMVKGSTHPCCACWWCLGTTRQGYPRHPLYVCGETQLREFK